MKSIDSNNTTRPENTVEHMPRRGLPHIVSYENTDRLKHEVAHYNPNHLNPDAMLNWILELYFETADKIRK